LNAVQADSSESYWQWQFDSSEKYLRKYCDLFEQIKGKTVLDLGCGLGGRTCFMCTKKPARVVGVDINAKEIESAKKFADSKLSSEDKSKLEFRSVNENETDYGQLFDIVLSIDSLEHVRRPVDILNRAWDSLKEGGICYFGTVGWYHHRASHLGSIIPIPFSTLFFSDTALLDAVKRMIESPYYVPSMWDSNPPIARWRNVKDLKERPGEYLNEITIRGIKKAIRESKFSNGDVCVSGFHWSRFPFLRIFNFLSKIPFIQEVYHSGVFGRLEKNKRATNGNR